MLERLFILRYIFGAGKGSIVKIMAVFSVGGITLGVLAMVVVMSVMSGFDQAIKTRLLGVEPHILVTDIPEGRIEEVQKLVGEKGSVARYSRQDLILRTVDGIFSGALAYGETPDVLKHLAKKIRHAVEVGADGGTNAIATAKSADQDIDFTLTPKEIAVGVDLARSLGIFEGDEVSLVAPESLLLPSGELPIYEKVKVRALVRTNVADIDSHVIFYETGQGLKKLRETASLESGLEIRLENPDEAIPLAGRLKKQNVGKVRTWADMNSSLFYSLKMEKVLMSMFLALTVLVSSFSVIVVLTLLVTDKHKDVGILKAMGATQGKIKRIFMSIGAALGLLGLGGGAALGLLICWILKEYPVIRLPDIYYDTTIPVKIDYFSILAIIVFGAILVIGGTLVPVRRIARYEPIHAIRHDDG